MRAIRLVSVIFLFVACSLLVAVPQAAAQKKGPPKRPAVPRGFVAEYDVPYVSKGDAAQTLDIITSRLAPSEKRLNETSATFATTWMRGKA